jgi:hypothetical protein
MTRNQTMSSVDLIQDAIAVHSFWKARLRTAVSSEKFDVAIATVKADDQCDFGKWLYGSELSAAEKETERCRTVRLLHAQFHQEAAKVVEWATSGQKSKAEEAIGLCGSYSKASRLLTEAMVEWRENLR